MEGFVLKVPITAGAALITNHFSCNMLLLEIWTQKFSYPASIRWIAKYAKLLVNTELDWTILVKADEEEQLYKLVNNSNLPNRQSAIGGTHHSRFWWPCILFLLCLTSNYIAAFAWHQWLACVPMLSHDFILLQLSLCHICAKFTL